MRLFLLGAPSIDETEKKPKHAASLESLAIYRKRPENKYASVRASESSVCDITELQSAHAPKSNYGSERRAQGTAAISDYLRNIALAQEEPPPKSAKTSKSSRSQKSIFALARDGDVISFQQQADDVDATEGTQREASSTSQQLPDSSATTYLPPKPVPPHLKAKSQTRRKADRAPAAPTKLSTAETSADHAEASTAKNLSSGSLPSRTSQNTGLTDRERVTKHFNGDAVSYDVPSARQWRVQAPTAKAEVERSEQTIVEPPPPPELTPRLDDISDIIKQVGGARTVLPTPASRRFSKHSSQNEVSPGALLNAATSPQKRPWARQLQAVMGDGSEPKHKSPAGGVSLMRGKLGRSDGFIASNAASPTRGETSSRLSAMKNANDSRAKHTSDSTWRIYQQLRVHRQ